MPEGKLEGEFVLNNKQTEQVIEKRVDTPSQNLRFFSSLSFHPKDVEFEEQEEDEEILLLIRRDLITNIPWILGALILILIPPLFFAVGTLFAPFIHISTLTQFALTLFYYLVVSGFILIQFTLWYFTVGLVTNKRIIDMNVSGILYKDISETRLNLVEDVTYSQIGSVRSVFNYGDVFVQTAAERENFEFERAPEPAKIVRIIADLIGGPR